MPPKSKVETSEHYEEIHELLLQGKSPRWISEYLEKEYGEIITYRTIYNYKNRNINLEDQTIEEVNKRKRNKKKTEATVKEKADLQEKIEASDNYVISQGADNLEGILDVAKNFPEDYKNLKEAANDEDNPVTEKDVANMSFKANKLFYDFIKSNDMKIIHDGEINHTGSITHNYELSKEDKKYLDNLLN